MCSVGDCGVERGGRGRVTGNGRASVVKGHKRWDLLQLYNNGSVYSWKFHSFVGTFASKLHSVDLPKTLLDLTLLAR